MKKLIGVKDSLFPWALHPNHLYEYGLEIGVPPESLLHHTGLEESALSNVDLLISWEQFKELSVNMSVHGPEDWGVQFGQRLDIGSHGLLSLLALNCQTLADLVGILEQYPVLVSPIFYVTRRETEEHIHLHIHPECTRHPILDRSLEAFVTMIMRTFWQLSGGQPAEGPEAVHLSLRMHEPSYAKAFYGLFAGQVDWNQPVDAIRVQKVLLNKPIPHANPVTEKTTRRILQAQLNQLPARKGVLHELRSLFSQGRFRQKDCADALFTSLPTLKRYLQAAQTTFSQELMHYRVEEACWMAEHTALDMTSASETLGFQDVSSFGRFFRHQLGQPYNGYGGGHKAGKSSGVAPPACCP